MNIDNDNYTVVDVDILGNYIQERFMLLIPRSLGKDMPAMVALLRETVTVEKAGFNSLGLLYCITGKQSDIMSLIDLGCIEWI